MDWYILNKSTNPTKLEIVDCKHLNTAKPMNGKVVWLRVGQRTKEMDKC